MLRRYRHPPRRVEQALRADAIEEVSLQVEDIDEAEAQTRDFLLLIGILQRIGDEG